MKTISIRELHTRTVHHVRSATRQPVAVTDRGETIAILQPATAAHLVGKPIPKRDRTQMPVIAVDSGDLISTDRDER